MTCKKESCKGSRCKCFSPTGFCVGIFFSLFICCPAQWPCSVKEHLLAFGFPTLSQKQISRTFHIDFFLDSKIHTNPFATKIRMLILLTVCHTFHFSQVLYELCAFYWLYDTLFKGITSVQLLWDVLNF